MTRGDRLESQAARRSFWDEVGETFPDLGEAASTDYYRTCEQRLFADHLTGLETLRLFKTDLWDEAKNTRILVWAHRQGAAVYGIDLSGPIARRARAECGGIRAVVADVRTIPFKDGSFDAVYSMGTIEHFLDPETGVAEIYRVLGSDGRAIIGVPNRHDPFLRPLMVVCLRALGLYGYGYERSYSRRELRNMLEAADFAVVAETGILFIPGWLRMLDLAVTCYWPRLAFLTRLAVRPFAALDRLVPAVRRHGYLLATVVTKRADRQRAATRPV